MTEKRPLDLDDLFRIRLIADPQISPDGSRVAFVMTRIDEEENDYVTNIYVVDRECTVSQFTSGNKDSAPRWSPDGKYLAFLSGRKEKAQVYLLPTSGGESAAVTDRKLGAGVPVWSPDSSAIAFTGPVSTQPEDDEEQGDKKKDEKTPATTKIVDRSSYKLDGAGYIGNRRRHLFLIDVETRTVEQLTDGDWHDDNAAWSPDSRRLAFASNRSPRWDVSLEGDIYVVSRSGGEAQQITSGGSYSNPVFSPDGGRIAFAGHEDPEEAFAPSRLYSVSDDGSDFRRELGDWDGNLGDMVLSDVVRGPDDIQLSWRPEGIYFLGTERGESNVYRAKKCAVHAATHGSHTVTGFSVEGETMAYTCGDATSLAEVFLCCGDRDEQLTRENDGFLGEVEIVPPERITFAGARGETSEGWIVPPQGHESGTHPLITYIHGGPHLAHGEALFLEYQLLAARGFGVFFPNIHGSASYGRQYQISIQGDWGNLDYQDVLAGTEEAASRSWVDRERLGIAGGSYGGYMTNWVLTHTNQFRAGVTERCLSNIPSFFGTSDLGWIWNRMYGLYPEDDFQKLWDMSPIKYVANVTTPLLVIHAERDDRTPIEQGEQMFNALRRLGKETKLIVFPDESHGLTRIGKPSRRIERMRHVLEWFEAHLAGS